MEDDQGEAGDFEARADRVNVTDEVVDRIHDAAIFLPAPHYPTWHRKAFIGHMVQTVTTWRSDGMDRDTAVEHLRRVQAESLTGDDERFHAETSRIHARVIDEVYGPEGESDG